MKGIILAGGKGTRLYPATKVISKQLTCIYDKPMIYYPIYTLIQAGINEILIISSEKDLYQYKELIGDGNKFGLKVSYAAQSNPNGIPEAFIIGEKFIGNDNVCLILGDNIFYGDHLENFLVECTTHVEKTKNALIIGYKVPNPISYGVMELDSKGNLISIEEKPKFPKSNCAVVGLYFYPNRVIEYSKKLTKSKRNELEISDLNNIFLEKKEIKSKLFNGNSKWIDAGTPESLLKASNFIYKIMKDKGVLIGCVEEISLKKGYISYDTLKKHIRNSPHSEYFKYLKKII